MSNPQQPEQASQPDVLRELYQQAVEQDRGPSAQSSAAILARAKQRAFVASHESAKAPSQAAANDRFWLRSALGSLAAVGLVGLLMLQHAAWWDGSSPDTGRGIGEPPQTQAEAASASATDDAVSAEVAAPHPASTPSVSDENIAHAESAPAASKAVRKAPAAAKSKEKQAQVQADKAVDAMDVEATLPVQITAPMAESSTASPQESSARKTANAKARAPSAEHEPSKNVEDQAKLPLCPMKDDASLKNAEVKDGVKGEVKGETKKAPSCRPRKAHEMRQDLPASGSNAAQGIAEPVQ